MREGGPNDIATATVETTSTAATTEVEVQPGASKTATPTSAREGKRQSRDSEQLRVFVSYSREDLDFADQLVIGLEFAGFTPTIDRHGISGGEEWRLRLGNIIRESDSVVFVLSPASAGSEICAWEASEAARSGRRIIPVLCRPLDSAEPPPQLSNLNYIYFYSEPNVPGSGFAAGLAALSDALNTDIEWHREHTRILQRATEWDQGGRQPSRLLSGTDIQGAKNWSGRRPRTAPEITELQLIFIQKSEEEAEARNNAERRRLEEIAAAQDARAKALAETEGALKQVADVQRRRAMLRNVLLAVMTLAAAISGWSWYRITKGNEQLAQQVEIASAAAAKAKSAERRARADEARAQQAELTAIINECNASNGLLKAHPGDATNLHNYMSCGARLGFALLRDSRSGSRSDEQRKALIDDARTMFGVVLKVAEKHGASQDVPIRAFYVRVVSQGQAIVDCTAAEPRSAIKTAAISRLQGIADAFWRSGPPSSPKKETDEELRSRWREEFQRAFFYLSECAQENSDIEGGFRFASQAVERLSVMPHAQGDSARDFARALDHLSWMALIARRPSEALGASERAFGVLKAARIDETDYLRLNRAHALLLNGRLDEARAEYRQLSDDDIERDLKKLIAAGVCDKLIGEFASAVGNCVEPTR